MNIKNISYLLVSYLLSLLILFFTSVKANATDLYNNSEYTYVNFNDFMTSYNANVTNLVSGTYDDKIVDITGNTTAVYLNPPEKYASFVQFRNSKRSVDTYNKMFLLRWFKLANTQTDNVTENTAQDILADGNFDALYRSYLFSSKGKTFYIITQRALGELMEKDIRNGESIKIYYWNLGQYQGNDPILVIVGYEKGKITKQIETDIFFREYLPYLKNDILNGKYDKAKGNIEMLLKQYPNNMDLKLSLCLIYKETNFYAKSIACYSDLIKQDSQNYDAYYGLASALYKDPSKVLKDKARTIMTNATKALDIIESMPDNNAGSLALIKYKSYFLRAMAKIALGDKSAINDLEKINQEQPVIISNESLKLYKQQLNMILSR